MTCDLETVASLPVVHAANQTVKSFFYAYRIDRHYEQNILNLELALLYLKCKVSNQTLISYRFLQKRSYLHVGINITFYLFIIFVDLSANVKFYFNFFSASVTFNPFYATILFPHLSCSLHSPFKNSG